MDYIYAIDSFIRKRVDTKTDIFNIIRNKKYSTLFFIQNHSCYKKVNNRNNGLYDEIIYYIFCFLGLSILQYDMFYAKNAYKDTSPLTTLFVHKGNIVCHRHKHPIVCVNATVYGINKQKIVINANYCKICKRTFISHFQFSQLKKKHKWLIGDFQYAGCKFDETFSSFSDTSPLMLCGYNVRSGKLSKAQRHSILASIIDCNVLSKSQVIKYLEGFIELNNNRNGLESALEKWQGDLTFIQSYKSALQKQVEILDIQKYHRSISSKGRER